MLISIVFALGTIFCIVSAFNTGFSSEKHYTLLLQGVDTGLLLSDTFMTIISIIVAIVLFFLTTLFFKSINEDYNKFIGKLTEIGNISVIADSLSKTQKSKLAEGELLCNNYVIFYMHGTNIEIVDPKKIIRIEPKIIKENNGVKVPYAIIYSGNIPTYIPALHKKNRELCEEIISKCNLDLELAD